MIRIAVFGCRGKMGQRIMELAAADKGCTVAAGIECAGHPDVGRTFAGVRVSDDLQSIAACDVVIDFTAPQASLTLLPVAVAQSKAMVIGTTGMEKDIDKLQTAAARIPIVFSPNMSVGVNVLFQLVRDAAEKLKDYRVSIVEAHHVHKKDAPSGTAKKLAQIIEAERSQRVEDIKAIREGEIIGDHTIRFESDVDVLELRHSAKTRDIFARGAVNAAKWVKGRAAGLYTMQDVLNKK